MRACGKCGKRRQDSEFYRDSKGKNGLSHRCKVCVKANAGRYYREVYRAKVVKGTGTNYRMAADVRSSVIRRYEGGESTIALGREFGYDPSTLQQMLSRHGVKMRTAGESRKGHSLNEAAFDVLTPQAAYWIGFLMADGCVVKRGSKAAIQLCLSDRDGSHVEAFKTFVGGTQKVHRIASAGYAGTPAVRYGVSSLHFAEILATYGVVPRKSKTAKVVGLERNRDFWRGVVDGDGWVRWAVISGRRYPCVGLVGSRPLCEQFRDFCASVAPGCSRRVGPMSTIWAFSVAGSYAAKIIRKLYLSAEASLTRKQEVADDILKNYRPPGKG